MVERLHSSALSNKVSFFLILSDGYLYIPTMPTKYDPDYYRSHKERHQATMKTYYAEKREERIAKSMAYYHAHRDEINAKRRAQRAAARVAID
jgi:hypothetical protein